MHPHSFFSISLPFYLGNIEKCEFYSWSVYCRSIKQQRKHIINEICLFLSIYEHIIKNNNKTTSFFTCYLYSKHEDRPIITVRHSDAFSLILSLNVSLIGMSVNTDIGIQADEEDEHLKSILIQHSWIL